MDSCLLIRFAERDLPINTAVVHKNILNYKTSHNWARMAQKYCGYNKKQNYWYQE